MVAQSVILVLSAAATTSLAANDAVACDTAEEATNLLQASVGRRETQMLNSSTIELKCFEQGWYHKPDMPGMRKTVESASKCQAYCMMTEGCKHFSFWPDNGCELQDADALKEPATSDADYKVLSGNKRGCSCFDSGRYWQPNMPGKKTTVKNAKQCQEECMWETHCKYFSFWPDHGCQLQADGPDLHLVTASNPKYIGVVTGPKYGCECFSLGSYYYPNIPDSKMVVGNEYECQNHCYMTKGCKTWSFWPDGGCVLQDAKAEKKKADNEEYATVLSGPKRGCFSIER